VPTAGVAVAGLAYLAAWRRTAPHRRPRARAVAYGTGLLALLVAVDGPPDALADRSFAAHMVQHLLIQFVAAPLLVSGGIVTLLLRADPPWLPRRVLASVLRGRAPRFLTRPPVALALFIGVLAGTHLSPLYDLALRHPWVHETEHVAYLVTALLLWWPLIGTDPMPSRPAPAVRLLGLMLLMAATALLGMAIAGAGHVLYPTYAAHPPPWGSALADQRQAGTLMWVSGMVTIVPAMAALVLRWLDEDARDQARRDPTRPDAARPT